MKQNNQLYSIIGALIIVGVLLVYLFNSRGEKSPKKINWKEHYIPNKDPFGTRVIYDLIQEKSDSFSRLTPSNTYHENEQGSTIIAIGQGFQYNEEKTADILDFVSNGNTLFLGSNDLPNSLISQLFDREDCEYEINQNLDYIYTDSIDIVVYDTSFNVVHIDSFVYQSGYGTPLYYWPSIDDDYLYCYDETVFVHKAYIQDAYPIYGKIEYGQGEVYLLTTPLLLTNYFMIKESGLALANSIFSDIPLQKVYWEEEALLHSRPIAYSSDRTSPFLSNKSPLQYVLTQPPLAWAWYILLTTGLLYMVFKSKRKQRIIPTIEENTNSSLAFVETMGLLYFDNHQHQSLALEMMKSFIVYIHQHHNVIIKDDASEEQINRLAKKLNVPTKELNQVFTMYKNIKKSNYTTSNTLITFYYNIQKIYNQI